MITIIVPEWVLWLFFLESTTEGADRADETDRGQEVQTRCHRG